MKSLKNLKYVLEKSLNFFFREGYEPGIDPVNIMYWC